VSLDDRTARAWLSATIEPALPAVAALVAQVGAPDAVRALSSGRSVPGLRPVHDADPGATGRAVLAAAGGTGMRWVCPGEPEWPSALDDLGSAGALHRRGGVPYGLWVRGDQDLATLTKQAVAVVGARASTSYGDDVAGDLGAGLGDGGISVISGAAYGIDAAAHRGVLAVGGGTVAVLACGADVVYPRGHEGLLAWCTSNGAVVSEAAPGAAPTKIRFLARNRLIAGLSRAVVVVEASWRSGSLTTLKWGELLSRGCLGVPGPVTSEASAGVHLALREHRAELVTNAAEVRDALAPLGAAPVDGVGTVGLGRTRATDRLDPRELEVLEALPAGADGLTPDQLSARTRLPVAAVRNSLVSLAERSLAAGGPQGWRLAPWRA